MGADGATPRAVSSGWGAVRMRGRMALLVAATAWATVLAGCAAAPSSSGALGEGDPALAGFDERGSATPNTPARARASSWLNWSYATAAGPAARIGCGSPRTPPSLDALKGYDQPLWALRPSRVHAESSPCGRWEQRTWLCLVVAGALGPTSRRIAFHGASTGSLATVLSVPAPVGAGNATIRDNAKRGDWDR